MADSKITALTELLSLAANDVLPIVEIASGTTKKVKYSTLLGALQTPWASNIDGNLKDLTNAGDITAVSFTAGASGVVTDKIISLTDITITANGVDSVKFDDTGLLVKNITELTGIGVGIVCGGQNVISFANIVDSAFVQIDVGDADHAQLSLGAGVPPTNPNDGDIWFDGTDLKMRVGGVTKTFTLT